MFCTLCGKQITDNAAFCTACGAKVPSWFVVHELDRIVKAQSDELYAARQAEISRFDISKVHISSDNPCPLTYPERYFLKHISKQPIKNPYVQGYWYYEYGLEYDSCVTKLLSNGYLSTSDSVHDFTFMTVSELKQMLKENSLSTSGNKRDLSARIQSALPKEIIKKYIINFGPQFLLTDLGTNSVNGLPRSITKDIDMEDASIQYLLNKDINAAYRCVCEFESRKRAPRGIGIDWNIELIEGLSIAKLNRYFHFLNADLIGVVPFEYMQYEEIIKVCTLLTVMLGMTGEQADILFRRTTELPKDNLLIQSFYGLTFDLM